MKKITLALLALICAFCCAFSFAACDTAPKVNELLVAKKGEQPDPGKNMLNLNVTYGQTPVLDYKLYVFKTDGDIKEISLSDEKLTVKYCYYQFNTEKCKTIEKLPEKYLAGSYGIEYIYEGNPEHKATVNISVNRATEGAFSVQAAKSTWYSDEKTPDVILKNPQGLPVKCENNASAQMQSNDTDGGYSFDYIKKEVYDKFTEAQKKDYEFITDFISADAVKPERDAGPYVAGITDNVPVGEYVLLARVDTTYNYSKIVTPATEITVRNPIIDRTFTFQNIAVQDNEGKPVTDEENEFVGMAESMNTYNQGKTVICKANGEVRGTVDFGGGAFDELSGEEVFRYSISGNDFTVLTQEGGFVGDGKKSGNTLTLKMPIDGENQTYYFIITFTCQ